MPSINQPGRVASDAITKAEVLDAITSDNQTFDGANIDAAVSSRATPADTGAGIDWSDKTPKFGQVGSTTFTVNGSGYLISLKPFGPTSDADASVTIDGTQVFSGQSLSDNDNSVAWTLFYRFDTKLEVSKSGAGVRVCYVID